MSAFVARSPAIASLPQMLLRDSAVHALAVNGLIVSCLTILLTVSDAFETGHLGAAHQSALWFLVSLLLVTQVSMISRVLEKLFPDGPAFHALAVGLSLAATIVLMTVELHWLKYTPLLPKQPDPFFEFLLFLTPPMGAMAALILAVQSLGSMTASLPVPEAGSDEDAALKVSAGETAREHDQAQDDVSLLTCGHTVHYVQAHDHYLEVQCQERRLLVRARMKDAVGELAGLNGLQVHRSHWVAVPFIKRLLRDGRDFKLELKDGSVVPVARSRSRELREKLESKTG